MQPALPPGTIQTYAKTQQVANSISLSKSHAGHRWLLFYTTRSRNCSDLLHDILLSITPTYYSTYFCRILLYAARYTVVEYLYLILKYCRRLLTYTNRYTTVNYSSTLLYILLLNTYYTTALGKVVYLLYDLLFFRSAVRQLCDTMKRQILSRAFYGCK